MKKLGKVVINSIFDNKMSICFMCKTNPRNSELGLCHSCELEYPFCYECGENERNIPYKLCLKCYHRQSGNNAFVLPSAITLKGILNSKHNNKQCRHYILITIDHQEPVFERLDSKKAEYKRTYNLFKSSWIKSPPPPEPEAIYAIRNKRLSESFKKHVQRLKVKNSDSTTSYNFHGTVILCNLLEANEPCADTDCGVCGIGRIGFDKQRIGTNIPRFKRFGHGFYLAPNSSKCHDYTSGVEEIGIRAQLLCSVASGTKFETMQNHIDLSGPPKNCDSVHGVKGGVLNYNEIVVFESEAILPEFVVLYRKDGVEQIAKQNCRHKFDLFLIIINQYCLQYARTTWSLQLQFHIIDKLINTPKAIN